MIDFSNAVYFYYFLIFSKNELFSGAIFSFIIMYAWNLHYAIFFIQRILFHCSHFFLRFNMKQKEYKEASATSCENMILFFMLRIFLSREMRSNFWLEWDSFGANPSCRWLDLTPNMLGTVYDERLWIRSIYWRVEQGYFFADKSEW